MTIVQCILALLQIALKVWPFFEDAITEDKDEFAASLHTFMKKLDDLRKQPIDERRKNARKAMRDLSDYIGRLR